MKAEDTTKIRGAIEQMSPSRLDRWLTRTQQLREYADSPEWQATKRWLREFLRVQAIYSDEEVNPLHKDIYNADAEQMLTILKAIQ